jgi:hypothetical protein
MPYALEQTQQQYTVHKTHEYIVILMSLLLLYIYIYTHTYIHTNEALIHQYTCADQLVYKRNSQFIEPSSRHSGASRNQIQRLEGLCISHFVGQCLHLDCIGICTAKSHNWFCFERPVLRGFVSQCVRQYLHLDCIGICTAKSHNCVLRYQI